MPGQRTELGNGGRGEQPGRAPRLSFPFILHSFFYLHGAPGTGRELNLPAIQSYVLKNLKDFFLYFDEKEDCERERRNLEEAACSDYNFKQNSHGKAFFMFYLEEPYRFKSAEQKNGINVESS